MKNLTIELVPKSSWYNNIRSQLSKDNWDKTRKKVYQKANYRCEICGGIGPKWPVEAHEIWEYNDKNLTQTLTGMIALCPDCHQVKHIGLAQINGLFDKAILHLAKVNGWKEEYAKQYVAEQLNVWKKRSFNKYIIDTSIINKYVE